MKRSAKYALAGTLAGIANGLFGSGGGLFLVPLFISWCGMKEKHAFATALAVILPLSAVSLIVFVWRGTLPWSTAWPYAVGGVLGGVASGWFFRRLSPLWLHRLFGALLLFSGIRAVLAL